MFAPSSIQSCCCFSLSLVVESIVLQKIERKRNGVGWRDAGCPSRQRKEGSGFPRGVGQKNKVREMCVRRHATGWNMRPTARCASDRWLPGRLQRARLLCRGPPAQPAEEEEEEDKVVAGRSGPTAQQSARISGATPSGCADAPPRERRQSSCRKIRPDCSAVGPNLGGYTQRVR